MSLLQAVFIGANRQSHATDFANGVVAYGAGTTVALWSPLALDHRGVYHTLNHHSKEVTCVKFLGDFLVSAGEDGCIVVWKPYRDGGFVKYSLHQTITQDYSITALGVADNVFVTGNSAGNLHVWTFDGLNFVSAATFRVRRNFLPSVVAFRKIEHLYLIVVGGTSSDIFVYSYDPEDSISVDKSVSRDLSRELAPENSLSQSTERASISESTVRDSTTNACDSNLGRSVKSSSSGEPGKSDSITECAVLSGHEDWVRCLAIKCERDALDYLLASGSQDRYIRLWRLRLNGAIDDSDEDTLRLILLTNKQHKFSWGKGRAAFSLEAVIMGHDDWVTGLQWRPDLRQQLLSLSADTALMVWEMDPHSGIWVCVDRLGELSIKGASTATGSSGGFWSCVWFANEGSQYIIANGKTGSIRMYRRTENEAETRISEREELPDSNSVWEACLGVTGPTRDVTLVAWESGYLLATSLDQTTRLFAPWIRGGTTTWHEFARPQIHGYDMECVAPITASRFVSGGDEKVLRVFDMTEAVGSELRNNCGIQVSGNLPAVALMPVLGLSNKAEGHAKQDMDDDSTEESETKTPPDTQTNNTSNQPTSRPPHAQASESVDAVSVRPEHQSVEILGPPLEDTLQRHTLFPEADKIYGHGYEVSCCAALTTGLVVSACRSNSAKHAAIHVYDSNHGFQQVATLTGHTLTVTALAFSPDSAYLGAVSRDRLISVWRGDTLELVELVPRAHARIVWTCAWAPSGLHWLVTGLRDRYLKVWGVGRRENNPGTKTETTGVEADKAGDSTFNDKSGDAASGNASITINTSADTTREQLVSCSSHANATDLKPDKVSLITELRAPAAVTAVACFPRLVNSAVLVAAGLDSGAIAVYTLHTKTKTFTKVADLPPSATKVCALAWTKGDCMMLAAASADHSVRIYTVEV